MHFTHIFIAVFGIASLQTAVEAYSYIDAINAIEDARQTIDNAANIAVEITELDLIKLQQLQLNRENLKLRYQMYFSVIDQLNRTATLNRIPVDNCLKSYPTLTQNYQNVTVFQQKNCVNKNSTVPTTLTKAVIGLKQNTSLPYTLLTDLNGCNYEASCIDQVVSTAKSVGKTVPKSVLGLITSNELLVYQTSTPLPQCQNSIEDGLKAAVNTAEVIVQCLSAAVFSS